MLPASRRKAVVATRWWIFKGEERKNDTHASTDPDVRLLEKSRGDEAKRCFIGHALMENRDGLAVLARPGRNPSHACRKTAEMIRASLVRENAAQCRSRKTLGFN